MNHVNSLYQHVMTADYVKTAEIVSSVLMSEPELDDDIALGKDDECADCNEHMSQCTCTEPDRMYGDED